MKSYQSTSKTSGNTQTRPQIQAILSDGFDRIAESLSPEQRVAAMAPLDEAVLIHAGAGTGKTRTLIARIGFLLQNGVTPNQIMAVTYTNKAAGEIQERLMTYFGNYVQSICCSTFHKFLLRVIRDNVRFVLPNCKDGNFRICDQGLKGKLVKLIVTEWKRLKENDTDRKRIRLATRDMMREITLLKCDHVDENTIKDEALKFVYLKYEEQKKAKKMIDFSDFMLLVDKLFSEYPRIAAYYATKSKYILIDEFQDTTALTFRIVRRMLQALKLSSLTVVGDKRQSIYGFNGAHPENVEEFFTAFPNARRFSLLQNFRSSETIIHIAEALFPEDPDAHLIPIHPGGGKVCVICAADSGSQAARICNEIEYLVKDSPQKFKYADICIMFRVWYVAAELELELKNREIPCTRKKGPSFFQLLEIKETLSFLRLSLADDQAIDGTGELWRCFETLNDRLELMGMDKMKTMRDRLQRAGPIYWLLHNGESLGPHVWKKIGEFCTDISRMHEFLLSEEARAMPVEEVLEWIIDHAGLRDESEEVEVTQTEGELEVDEEGDDYLRDRNESLTLLVDEGKYFTKQLPEDRARSPVMDRLRGFLAFIALERTRPGTDNRVMLSTIHTMKGLESRVCFIAHFNLNMLPLPDREGQPSIEEERRVCYVGLTRACELLYFSYILTYNDRQRHPSPFLEEIIALRPDLIDRRELTERMVRTLPFDFLESDDAEG